jgi:putative transposase
MPRSARNTPGGIVYHALNRAVARLTLFEKEADYEAFERVLHEAHERTPIRILAYCLMPSHWHFLLWPEADGELTGFLRWLTNTHTMRWHAHHRTFGTGHLYQGRFKSFPVQSDEYLYTVLRYVERNPVRSNLVPRAEQWRWSSLWRRQHGNAKDKALLSRWPIDRPRNWVGHVNQPITEEELEALTQCVRRGTPYGTDRWRSNTAVRLGLEHSLRPRGRPKRVKR